MTEANYRQHDDYAYIEGRTLAAPKYGAAVALLAWRLSRPLFSHVTKPPGGFEEYWPSAHEIYSKIVHRRGHGIWGTDKAWLKA